MIERPFFSIIIPQYNRADKLLRLLESICAQHFRDIEICISDGGSTDDSIRRARDFLSSSGVTFTLRQTSSRAFYDENIRNAFSLARGKYSLVMGNDDILLPDSLSMLYSWIEKNGRPDMGVLVTNFKNIDGTECTMRVGTVMDGRSVANISQCFRRLSFVSGILFLTSHVQGQHTDLVDGSEMYQMYLASRLLADGYSCYFSSIVLVGKDNGDLAPILPSPCKTLPMSLIPLAIEEGLIELADRGWARRELSSVLLQLLMFIYPYWAYVWKLQHPFVSVLRLYLTLNPKSITRKLRTKFRLNAIIGFWVVYIGFSILVFLTPKTVLTMLLPLAHRLAKFRTRGLVIYNKQQ